MSHGCRVSTDAAEVERYWRAWGHRMEYRATEAVADQVTGLWHAQSITRGAVAQTGNMKQGGQFGTASRT